MRDSRAWLMVSFIMASFPTSTLAADRPNVLVIMTDDQGYGDFSAHGNPVLKTPHLDRLRSESVRLADFHVAPMCTPTRGQLMTGVDAVRNGATSVTGGRSFLRPGIPTMPEVLRASGYRTGLFGKWHLGDNYPNRPMDKGFQEAYYHLGWGFTSAPEFANTLFDGRAFHNGSAVKFDGHCTDFWFDRAIAWMRQRHANSEPFFCYLPTNAPHAPLIVADKYKAPYQGKGPAAFFGMIAQIDENIGRVETFLRDTGLRENTIVVFLTDNGGTAGVSTFNAGMRGAKTTYYEGGHRVPCWVRWPAGALGEPRDIDGPTQVQDLLPTLIDLVGSRAPQGAQFDGLSLADVLRGRAAKVPDRIFVVQYSRAKLEKWQCCVVADRWRLVNGQELYDLSADPEQEDNVAEKQPEVLGRLRDHYEKWWAGLGDKVSQFVPIQLGTMEAPEVWLSSSDWQDVYADNAGHVRHAEGGPRGGPWNVNVMRSGEYEVSLSRWPREVDKPLTDAYDVDGRALPIARGVLTIAGQELATKAAAGSSFLTFRLRLPEGPTQLCGWFQDENGQDLCGAFYAQVRRLD